MTVEEKVAQIRKFVAHFEEIIRTADVDRDCEQALPRFHKCEQNLIAFLCDAGFDEDAAIISSHAEYIPATYGTPLINTMREDVEFYAGKLNALVEDLENPVYARRVATAVAKKSPSTMTVDVFVSHSSRDEQLANALIKVLEAAFGKIKIRCSSVPRYRFTVGGDYRAQLRAEVDQSTVFIALLTPASLRSSEVLFEIGARWGADKLLLPLLASGATPALLSGLLRVLQGVELENYEDLKTVMNQIAEVLCKKFSATSTFNGAFGVLRAESERRASVYSPRLQIREARWGARSRQRDVTELVRANLQKDKLVIQASVRTFDDPAPMEGKKLKVKYVCDGEEKEASVTEHDWLVLPED